MNFKRRFVSIVSAAVCTLSLSMASLTANAEINTTESVSESYVQETERNNYSLDVSSQTVLTLSKEVSTKSKEAAVTTTVSAVKSETVSTAVVVSHRHEVSVSVYIPVTSAASSTSVTPVTLTTTNTTAMSIAGWYFTDVTCEASAERIAVKPSEKVSMKLDLMFDKDADAKVNLDLPEGITVENVYDENENVLEYSSSDNSFTLSGRYALLNLNVDSEIEIGTYQIGFDISQRKNVPNTLNNGGIAYNYVYSVSGGNIWVKDPTVSEITANTSTTTTTVIDAEGWSVENVNCEAVAENADVNQNDSVVSMKLDLKSNKGVEANISLRLYDGITVESIYDDNGNKLEYDTENDSFALSGTYAVLNFNIDSQVKTGKYQVGFDITQHKYEPNNTYPYRGGIAYNYDYFVLGGIINVKELASTTTNITDTTIITTTSSTTIISTNALDITSSESSVSVSTETSSESSVSVSTDGSGSNTSETTEPLTTTSVSFTSGDGDANDDGKLDVRDAAEIARAAANGKLSDLPASSDYNGDGVVNVRDAAAIARVLAKREILNK